MRCNMRKHQRTEYGKYQIQRYKVIQRDRVGILRKQVKVLSKHIIQHQYPAYSILYEPITPKFNQIILDIFLMLFFVLKSIQSIGHFFFVSVCYFNLNEIVVLVSVAYIILFVAHVPFLA